MVVRRVKGTLFVDYVRMMRSHKSGDWSRYLTGDDLRFLQDRIAPDSWYPMDVFERMGLAILAEIAQGDVQLSRSWGKAQVEWLIVQNPGLVALGDPCDTLMRFRVLRNSFFDYPALEIRAISEGEASIEVTYGMSPTAEQAASLQTMGFFERMLEYAGAKSVTAWFSTQSWTRDLVTTLQLRWTS